MYEGVFAFCVLVIRHLICAALYIVTSGLSGAFIFFLIIS